MPPVNVHHRDTESTENDPEGFFVPFSVTSVSSVPLW